MEPSPTQLKAYAENQVEVTRARGEYACANEWEIIAGAASRLIKLSERIEAKRVGS
jgi:hypothetical protein